jgi:ankyrin repeat protein
MSHGKVRPNSPPRSLRHSITRMDKDNRGGTALMAAKREGHKEIVRILKEAGAKE